MARMEVLKGRNNSVLRTVSVPVQKIDAKIKNLIQKMEATVKEEEGVGIAAPQVGENVRLILALLGKKFWTLINPVILEHSAEKNKNDEEGCLSVPGEFGNVARYNEVVVEFLNEKGMKKKLRLKNFDARVVQHEIDHLDGVLFVDRMEESDILAMQAAQKKEKSEVL